MSKLQSNIDFVHRYLSGKNGDTLLLLHGTGGDESDLLPLGAKLAPRAGLLGVRGKVLENGMPRFFKRLAMGIFDQEDLKFRTNELADFVTVAAETYGFDRKKVTAFGYSNGANIAASLLFRRPEILASAILLRPMVPFLPDQLPQLAGKGIYIAGGRQDPIVPPEQTENFAELLRKAGADVTVAWHSGGHELTAPEIERAKQWFAERKLARENDTNAQTGESHSGLDSNEYNTVTRY
jgi:predicted esterase